MSSSPSLLSSLFLFSFFILCCSTIVQADVPSSKTFQYVNDGESYFGMVEDNAKYRPLSISSYPFQLCFYNSTENAYFLGLGLGNANSTSLMRWVWTANRARPVGENAKLIFSRNGNLALVDANGRVAWQTRTANKGVVDIKLLPNGNLVLLDKKGGFVWQSFDYPTDTLLVGQSLRVSHPNKLVSGAYSIVLDRQELNMFYKSPVSSKQLRYFNWITSRDGDGGLQTVAFNTAHVGDGPDYANDLRLEYVNMNRGWVSFAQPKYNSTMSLFRLGSDGNIHIYTYYEKGQTDMWEETYTMYSKNGGGSECLLPEKCGSFGLCEDSQCVACPTPKGLMGWSKDCKPSKLPSCNVPAANVTYYKLDGVEYFLDTNNDGEGPMKIGQCRKKCSNDCKCVAFFYRKESSMCLTTVQLGTLFKAGHYFSNTEFVAYIKYA